MKTLKEYKNLIGQKFSKRMKKGLSFSMYLGSLAPEDIEVYKHKITDWKDIKAFLTFYRPKFLVEWEHKQNENPKRIYKHNKK